LEVKKGTEERGTKGDFRQETNYFTVATERRRNLHDRLWNCSGDGCSDIGSSRAHAVGFSENESIWAGPGDVSYFATSVAGFGTFVRERAAVWRSAVARDVTEFTASVALHGLGLAIASIMIRATAFVASRSAGNAGVPTTETTITAARATAAAHRGRTCGSRIGAVTLSELIIAFANRSGFVILLQYGLLDRKSSIDSLHHSDEESGSPPEHDRFLGSDSIA
jgi:hypothetical protein